MTELREQLKQKNVRDFLFHFLILIGLSCWAYWSTFMVIVGKWNHSPEYSHGYLVPLFSLALLWTRREKLDLTKIQPSTWGIAVIAIAIGMRLLSVYYYLEWFDFLSIIPFTIGICLLAGGWHTFRWAWSAIAFLGFMLPLPYSLEVALRGPLRSIGTKVSTYVMQTLGLPALAEGNVIIVGDAQIGVTEACSGLSMLMVFFAFSTATALFIHDRPVWEKILVIASAIPIAIIANVTRITVTGLLYATGFSEMADLIFHDFAGWMMIPLALAILWLELLLVSRIVIVEDDAPMAVGLGRSKS